MNNDITIQKQGWQTHFLYSEPASAAVIRTMVVRRGIQVTVQANMYLWNPLVWKKNARVIYGEKKISI